MPLLFDPGSKLYGIVAVTLLLTSILIAAEANSVGAGSRQDGKREGPVAWFFFSLLLWIIAFPMWMARRSKYGMKNLCASAILIGLAYVGVIGLMATVIEQAKADIRKGFEDIQQNLDKYSNAIRDVQTEFQNTGEEQTINVNLMFIDSAKEIWALANKKCTGSLPSKKDIIPHMGEAFPTSPPGAVYEINPIGQSPACIFREKRYILEYEPD